ncbi:MAG: 1,4-dihydroxy-2-naphthoate polyprenyltransferase [Bacteroidetes bacterium]|nr:1,4-dihydroxy-2-naphthoate polyprenyltransferase [Bacteroidota bacterium]
MNSLPSLSDFKVWTQASRPKTLAAAAVPVIVGSALAFSDGFFDLIPALFALICAMLIQIGTNFANDYYDFVKGADTVDRIGFERATSSGKIAPKSMLLATILTMGIAFLLGLYLVWHAGFVVLIIGVLSLIFGIAYTGGPFPLGYNGLGDLFVFIFFGFVAVMTTYYVQALEWSMITFWAALAVGALATNILVVNNLRDSDQDRITGKRTLGVMLGDNALRLEYTALTFLAFAIPPHYVFAEGFSFHSLLPLLTIPLFVYLNVQIWSITDKKLLNGVLEKTALAMTLFGLLLALGLAYNHP